MMRWERGDHEKNAVTANIRTIRMKQINVFPMLMLLIAVLFLIAWLGGYL